MWIQVRTMDGKLSKQVDGLSKLTKIDELREIIDHKFGIKSSLQRLFFRGKQMENGYTLFDYSVGLNDIIQLLERKVFAQTPSEENIVDNCKIKEKIKSEESKEKENRDQPEQSPEPGMAIDKKEEFDGPYKVNDLIDIHDPDTGAWFEATITKLSKQDGEVLYDAALQDYEETRNVKESAFRPRARKLLEWDEINVDDKVMLNYNIDKPKSRGFWYDGLILEKKTRKKSKALIVRLILGADKNIEPCSIIFVEEVFAIEKAGKVSHDITKETSIQRETEKEPECGHCKDNPRRKCKECGCHVCGEKSALDKTLLCDECNLPFHTFCLDPPLDALPDEDEWFCPLCRQDTSVIVKAGEKLKHDKKKSKMKSATSETTRDWGKGMACVGRSKICTIVPSTHVGPVPGVPVGSLWKFRVQVSEAGVHRPHVSGIHGKESTGAYSIVLAGGYEDDEDNGDEFTYTGSGGRDLSGNKRTAEQSCDQILTKNNMAIARTCNAKADAKKGGEADDWKKSRGIRVVRNYKGAKHSDYAPEEGNRYDGIYKVVKYWPEKGKSGFIVWRYLLRRDDPEAAPWTKQGIKRSNELGIAMVYPDGYLEAQAQKENSEGTPAKKRKRSSTVEGDEGDKKKQKVISYKIPKDMKKLIDLDANNKKVWDEAIQVAKEGKTKFEKKLQDVFACVCCQDLVYKPITTTCNHNLCKDCLSRSFKAEIYSCPMCRTDLGKNYVLTVNDNLQKFLLTTFPGYDVGR